jgi:hypothetical protein
VCTDEASAIITEQFEEVQRLSEECASATRLLGTSSSKPGHWASKRTVERKVEVEAEDEDNFSTTNFRLYEHEFEQEEQPGRPTKPNANTILDDFDEDEVDQLLQSIRQPYFAQSEDQARVVQEDLDRTEDLSQQ